MMYTGYVDCFKKVRHYEGVRALYNGLGAQVHLSLNISMFNFNQLSLISLNALNFHYSASALGRKRLSSLQ